VVATTTSFCCAEAALDVAAEINPISSSCFSVDDVIDVSF
jgi:hypothetical protein